MPTQLARHVQSVRLVDTHEHLKNGKAWEDEGPDILQALFSHYIQGDLVVAGATPEQLRQLNDAANPDVAARFAAIRPQWELAQFTGYGEAVKLMARVIYGIDPLTPEAIEQAQEIHNLLRAPGERYRLLHDVANLDHVQIDDFTVACRPDETGPGFFLYDLSIADFVNGKVDAAMLKTETKVDVRRLEDYRNALAALFAKYGPVAIAVKSQHAYARTLAWQARSDSEAETALSHVLMTPPERQDAAKKLCLGDWALARCVELATEHHLPVKLHTGYHAGTDYSEFAWMRPSLLCPLLRAHPAARFVLMHTGYPYGPEVIALAKHYSNVYSDLCWAWAVDPLSTTTFVRTFLHAAPIHKLFAFGGDTFWPMGSLAYAAQARKGIENALGAELADGYLTEKEALFVADRIMHDNQYAVFDITGRRAAIEARLKAK